MIQRIQTLFLLIVTLLSGLMLSGDLLLLRSGGGTLFSFGFYGVGEYGGKIIQSLLPLKVVMAATPLLALTAIFLFRNRKLQMRIAMLVLLLSLGTILLGAFYILMFNRKIEISVVWKIKALFPLLSAVFAWLAWRAVSHDEEKVRSYDRLR